MSADRELHQQVKYYQIHSVICNHIANEKKKLMTEMRKSKNVVKSKW
jgi:hypothetical protein